MVVIVIVDVTMHRKFWLLKNWKKKKKNLRSLMLMFYPSIEAHSSEFSVTFSILVVLEMHIRSIYDL